MAVVLTFAGASAGGEGRPHRRPVRQAALRADRDGRRRRAAELSRRHRQRHRLHAGGAHARSAAPAHGLPPVGGDAQPAARLRHGRLCQPRATCISWMLGFVKDSPPASATRSSPTGSPRRLDFMRACGIDPRRCTGAAHDRFLHQPRGAAARLRAGDDPRRFDHRRLVRDLRPHASGSATARASPTMPMSNICRGIKNPIGLKCGPSLKPDELLRLIDMLNPDNEPGRLTLIGRFGADKVDEHLPDADPGGEAGGPQAWCGPAIRMHGNTIKAANGYKTRPFDMILSEVRELLRRAPRRGHPCRRHPCRDDRQERHRMHRRRPASSPMTDLSGPLPHPLRSAAECQPGARAGVPGRRAPAPRPRDSRGASGAGLLSHIGSGADILRGAAALFSWKTAAKGCIRTEQPSPARLQHSHMSRPWSLASASPPSLRARRSRAKQSTRRYSACGWIASMLPSPRNDGGELEGIITLRALGHVKSRSPPGERAYSACQDRAALIRKEQLSSATGESCLYRRQRFIPEQSRSSPAGPALAPLLSTV